MEGQILNYNLSIRSRVSQYLHIHTHNPYNSCLGAFLHKGRELCPYRSRLCITFPQKVYSCLLFTVDHLVCESVVSSSIKYDSTHMHAHSQISLSLSLSPLPPLSLSLSLSPPSLSLFSATTLILPQTHQLFLKALKKHTRKELVNKSGQTNTHCAFAQTIATAEHVEWSSRLARHGGSLTEMRLEYQG